MRRVIYSLFAVLTAGCLYLYAQAGTQPSASTAELSPKEQAATATWLTDHAEAVAKAKAENKYLLINFTGSDWCPPCIMMKREVYTKPEFVAFAKEHLVLNEVDFPRYKKMDPAQLKKNEQLAGQYGTAMLPTVFIVSPEGKIVARLPGYQGDAKNFIAKLEDIIKAE